MRPKGQISPSKYKGKETYAATFVHPILKKRVCRGLGTKNEAAARRICDGLEFLCANPTASALAFHDRDPRAWEIFHKDSQHLEVELPGLVDTAREIFPEMSDKDMALALPFVSDENGTHMTLIEALPSIVTLVATLKKQHVTSETFDALKKLLGDLGYQLAKERNKRKYVEAVWNSQLHSDHEEHVGDEQKEYRGEPEHEDFETVIAGLTPDYIRQFRANLAALKPPEPNEATPKRKAKKERAP